MLVIKMYIIAKTPLLEKENLNFYCGNIVVVWQKEKLYFYCGDSRKLYGKMAARRCSSLRVFRKVS
jgi:dephospho-CoA kinase